MKGKANRGHASSTNPSASATIYRGPLRTPIADGDNQTTTVMISATGSLTTNGGGVATGIKTTGGVTETSEWASWSALYQEWRVLAFEWSFNPTHRDAYVTSDQVPALGAAAIFHQPSYTQATSVAELVNNRTFKEFNTARPLTLHWKMSGPDESTFQRVADAASYGGVDYYADGGTASTTMGRFFVRYLVQFKGRK